ncbi:MAG: hypothetical protein LBQ57_02790 [Spirochaetales bacterium]|jgi:hypothetical protein|nr:hypothetical protein [Spirochaetales bacterium]
MKNAARFFAFCLLLVFFINVVLFSAAGWFAGRDSRSQKLVGELKRNLERLEEQLAGSLDTAEQLGRIVENLGGCALLALGGSAFGM